MTCGVSFVHREGYTPLDVAVTEADTFAQRVTQTLTAC